MRHRSPVGAEPYLSVTTLPTAGDEVEPLLARISPGSPKKLSVVHSFISAHICAIINR